MELVLLVVHPPLQGAVPLVVVGVAHLARLYQGLGLGLHALAFDVVEDNLQGDDGPQHLVLGHGALHVLVVEHVVHQPLGQVVPRRGDVVAAAALAQVHLKELVGAVPVVILHVEVGKAHVANALQEILHLLVQLFVVAVDDGRVAADALGGVLLQQSVAQGDELYLPVPAAVAVHHPHVAVVPGDVLLQNQVVLVAGGVNGLQNGGELLPALGHKHLLLVGEPAVPIGHRIGGLDNHGEVKGQLHVFVVLIGAGGGLGEGEAVLGAHLVEALLDGEAHQQLLADALEHIGAPQLLLVAHQQLDVVVPAGHQQQLFAAALVAFGKVQQGFDEDLVVLQVGLHHLHGDDFAGGAGAQNALANGHGLDAVLLVEGAGHAIDVDVAAQQDRLKIDFLVHDRFLFQFQK